MTRQQDTLDARAAADEWAAARGLPSSGSYSGSWYRDGYLGGWWPDGWLKWWAAYGIAPGSIIGGDIVAHQYGSTPVDMDVMLESEIVTAGGTPPVTNEPVDCAPYKAALERGVNRLQIELDRQTAAGKPAPLRRTIIQEIAGELFTALNS